MTNYVGDIRLGDTIDVKFCTVTTTGAPTTLVGSPVISAYPGNSTTQLTAGITLTVDFDGVTGLHNVRVVATSGNGYATATNYYLVITTGTVGGTSVVGYVIGSFSIEARSALMPTTAARTLDVSAGGEAGLDWANIGSPTTAQNLSATNIDVDQVVASVSGAVGSVTGNVGGNVTGSVGSVAAGGITAASIATGAIDADALAADAVAEIADGVWDEDATGHQTQGTFGQAIGDPGADTDTIWALVNTNLDATVGSRATQTSVNTIDDFLDTEIAAIITTLGTPAGVSISADILTIDNLVDDLESRVGTPSDLGSGATVAANLVDIEGQTDDIGAAGAGLTAIPWNAAWDAEVQSEVDDALVARFLDKLVIVNGTADSGSTTTMVDAARTEADNDYWKGRFILFTSGNISGQCAIITDFVAATDTFTFAPPLTQAVTTQTYVILPGLSVWDDTLAEHLIAGSTGAALNGATAPTVQQIVDGVWDEALASHLDAGSTGEALNAAGGAGDPWITALPGAYGAGSAGFIVGTNLDATVSSRASQTSLNTLDDYVDTEVAAIKAKTDQLTFTAANQVDANALSMANGVITAAVIATDAIDADALAANAVTEIQAGLSTLTAAQVNTEVDTALADVNLDHLVGTATGIPAIPAGTYIDQMMDDGTAVYDRTTDSLQAIRDRGDAAWTTATGFSTLTQADVRTAIGLASANLDTQLTTIDDLLDTEVAAIKAKTDQLTFTSANKVDATIQAAGDFAQAAADKVWSTAARTLTAFGFSVTVGTNNDKTGYTLSAAGIQAVWDALTAALTTVGSIGKLLVDNVNATISSRSSHSAADVWAVATRLLTAGTNIVLAKGVGVTGFNDLSAAQVNAEVDTALADYDAPTSAELVSEINSVQADIAALNNLSAAQVNAEVVDVLRVDTLPDSYAADGAQPTMAQATLAILQFLTEKSVAGTTVRVNKPDGTTQVMTFTLDSGVTPTSITRAT